ncbi:hypothetical protein COO60DRAFT_187514 [Scenedesmus sp. NREL 46B-D3]|nr:hypothetical protein COO60DRAFT_187514 [Scenedesmus sp. NREL 46B-D3]
MHLAQRWLQFCDCMLRTHVAWLAAAGCMWKFACRRVNAFDVPVDASRSRLLPAVTHFHQVPAGTRPLITSAVKYINCLSPTMRC